MYFSVVWWGQQRRTSWAWQRPLLVESNFNACYELVSCPRCHPALALWQWGWTPTDQRHPECRRIKQNHLLLKVSGTEHFSSGPCSGVLHFWHYSAICHLNHPATSRHQQLKRGGGVFRQSLLATCTSSSNLLWIFGSRYKTGVFR